MNLNTIFIFLGQRLRGITGEEDFKMDVHHLLSIQNEVLELACAATQWRMTHIDRFTANHSHSS